MKGFCVMMLAIVLVLFSSTTGNCFNKKYNHEASGCFNTIDIEETWYDSAAPSVLHVLTTLKDTPSCKDNACANRTKTVTVTSASLQRFRRNNQPAWNSGMLPVVDHEWNNILIPPGPALNTLIEGRTTVGPVTGWAGIGNWYVGCPGNPPNPADYLFGLRLALHATHYCDGTDCGCPAGNHTISCDVIIQVSSGSQSDRTLSYAVGNFQFIHSPTANVAWCSGSATGTATYNATAFASNASITHNFGANGNNLAVCSDSITWIYGNWWNNPPDPWEQGDPLTVVAAGAQAPDVEQWTGTFTIRDVFGPLSTRGEQQMNHQNLGADWIWDANLGAWTRVGRGCH